MTVRQTSVPATATSRVGRVLEMIAAAMLGAVLLAWAAWSTVVGFGGGVMPLFGWHTNGTVGHGLIALFGTGGISIGIFALAITLVPWVLGRPSH